LKRGASIIGRVLKSEEEEVGKKGENGKMRFGGGFLTLFHIDGSVPLEENLNVRGEIKREESLKKALFS